MSLGKKTASIKTMLDKMVSADQTYPNWIDNEKTIKLKEKFDPRDAATYQYADYNKQLVINDIPIYRYERDNADRFIKKSVDEGNFAGNLEFMKKNIPDYQLKNGYQAYPE